MAHGITILAHVLKMISSAHITALDKAHGTGRLSRVLNRWSQFGALVFAPLAGTSYASFPDDWHLIGMYAIHYGRSYVS